MDHKIARRATLTVTESSLMPSSRWDSDIYSLYQRFTFRHRHLRGSTRPADYYRDTWSASDATVEIRWLWTNNLKFFGPELTYRPAGHAIAKLLVKALEGGHWEGSGDRSNAPSELVDRVGAIVVERVEDKEGCWNDYRTIRVPGEPAVATLARCAEEDR